jgi:hypothetical protein
MQKPNRNSITAIALCGGHSLKITNLKAVKISSVYYITSAMANPHAALEAF